MTCGKCGRGSIECVKQSFTDANEIVDNIKFIEGFVYLFVVVVVVVVVVDDDDIIFADFFGSSGNMLIFHIVVCV